MEKRRKEKLALRSLLLAALFACGTFLAGLTGTSAYGAEDDTFVDDIFLESDADGSLFDLFGDDSDVGEDTNPLLVDQAGLLVDQADLLTDSEEARLLSDLTEVSQKEEMDVVVVTVPSIGTQTPEAFADDFFDYNGYGQGADHDGVLLLVSMADRDWHISTTGFGITAVNDKAIDLLEDRVVPRLSSGDYYEAFSSYCSTVDQLAAMAREGNPYNGGSLNPMPTGQRAGIAGIAAIVLGFLIGWIATAIQKKRLKKVRLQRNAAAYIYAEDSHLDVVEDRFINKTLNRIRIQHDDDSRGGGGVHMGSSGTFHGGGGGKF